MKKTFGFLAVMAVAAACFASGGSESDRAEFSFVASSSQHENVTLQSGEWGGGYYAKAALTPGNPYVVWISGNNNVWMDAHADWWDENAPNTWFETKFIGDTTYYFIRADGWDSGDTRSSYYYLFDFLGEAGESVTFHYAQMPIDEIIPKGVYDNPEQIDVSTEGSCIRDVFAGELAYYCAADLKAGGTYFFTTSPSGSGTDGRVTVESTDYGDNVEIVPYADQSGAVGQKVLCLADTTVRITIMPWASGSPINLSWRMMTAGTVGFANTSVTVSETDGVAVLSVSRQTADVPVTIRWMTVAETAVRGENYMPASGTISWQAGEDGAKSFAVRILPDLHPRIGDSVRFAVKLVSDESSEYKPVIAPAVARITITPAGTVEPKPVKPTAEDEVPTKPLAVGSFAGVLLGEAQGLDAVAQLAVNSLESGTRTARLTVNGKTYEFSGTGAHLDGTTAGTSMELTLPAGTVADLAAGASEGGRATVTLDDTAETRLYEGRIFRLESQKDTPAINRLYPRVGRYTVALAGDGQVAVPTGNGYLSLAVDADGTVSGIGRLADGKDVSIFAAKAFDVAEGIAIPLFWQDDQTVFGGTLIVDEEGLSGDLDWSDVSTRYGLEEKGFRMAVTPFGGSYDATARVEAVYNGWCLENDECTSAFYGLCLMATNGTLKATDGAVSLNFNQSTGIVQGSLNGVTFSGVLLPGSDLTGYTALAGYETADGSTRPFTLNAKWLDPDLGEHWGYSSTISFNANGGVGEISPIVCWMGDGPVTVPPSGSQILKTGYELIGWERSDTGEVLPPQTQLNPPPANLTLKALWTFSVKGIAEALGCPYLTFTSDGDAGWFVDASTVSPSGSTTVRSGKLSTQGRISVLSVTLKGAGDLNFKYMVTKSMFDAQVLTVSLDGVNILSSMSCGWKTFGTQVVGTGEHRLVFTYTASTFANDSVGVWLAEMSFGRQATVTFDPADGRTPSWSETRQVGYAIGELPLLPSDIRDFKGWQTVGGNPVTKDFIVEDDLSLVAVWAKRDWTLTFSSQPSDTGSAPAAITQKEGTTALIPGAGTLVRAQCDFAGWDDGAKVWTPGETFTFGTANVTMTPKWEFRTDGIAEALGCPGWSFSATGDAPWAPDASSGGVRSGTLASGQSGTLSTTVTGVGYLKFLYSVSGASAGAFTVTVDGRTVLSAANTNETAFSRLVSSLGSHAVAFTHTGVGTSHLKDLRYVAAATVRFDPGYGGAVTNEYREPGVAIGTWPVPASDVRDFVRWQTAGGEPVTVETVVPAEGLSLTAVWEAKPGKVTFLSTGAEGGEPPKALEGRAGDVVKIPGAGTLVKTASDLKCWNDGAKDWYEGDDYTLGVGEVTMTPVWKFSTKDIAAALGVPFLDFEVSGDANWYVDTSTVSPSGSTTVRSGKLTAQNKTSVLSVTLKGAGDLNFKYKVTKPMFDAQVLTVSLDGVNILSSMSCDWKTFGTQVVGTGEHRLVFTYTASTFANDSVGVWLAEMSWVPDTVAFSIMPKDSTVTAIKWTLDGVEQGGSSAALKPEQTVSIADVFYALGYKGAGTYVKGYSYTVKAGDSAQNWSVASTAVSQQGGIADLPDDVTPAEAGITGGEFAKPGTTSADVKRVVGWALAKDAKDAVNTLAFSDAAYGRISANEATDAYLLNCAPSGVAAAKANFKITSIAQGTDGKWAVGRPEGDFNGHVELLEAQTPGGPWSKEAVETDGRLFYKAVLVK